MRGHAVAELVGEPRMPARSLSARIIGKQRLVGVLPAGVGALHRGAEVALEDGGGPVDDVAHGGVDGRVAQVRAVGHPQPAQVAVGRAQPVDVVGADGEAVALVVARDDGEGQRRVGDGAGERADVLQRLPAGHAGVALVLGARVERYAAHRRLDAVDAAEAGRDADRAAAVAAE